MEKADSPTGYASYIQLKPGRALIELVGNIIFQPGFFMAVRSANWRHIVRRGQYEHGTASRSHFDLFDGFDRISVSTRFNMNVVDLPVRFRGRKYGRLLLKMVLFAAVRI